MSLVRERRPWAGFGPARTVVPVCAVDTRRAIVRLMGSASLVLGLVGAAKPSLPARVTGASEDEARELGFRDLVVVPNHVVQLGESEPGRLVAEAAVWSVEVVVAQPRA
jgi:hypothetical protein